MFVFEMNLEWKMVCCFHWFLHWIGMRTGPIVILVFVWVDLIYLEKQLHFWAQLAATKKRNNFLLHKYLIWFVIFSCVSYMCRFAIYSMHTIESHIKHTTNQLYFYCNSTVCDVHGALFFRFSMISQCFPFHIE